MLQSSVFSENSGGGDDPGGGGPAEDGDRSSPGNRSPDGGTLALLKVRSDMDLAFKDPNLEGPLWDEVSRKLGELGYSRDAEKCREQFESICKYQETDPVSCNRDFTMPCSFNQDRNAEFMSASTSSSGEESDGSVKKKKRKLAAYFERLMKEVLKKQEDFQNKFLEMIERFEKDRIAREEAWKAREMARVKREQEYLARERANAAAKDTAVLDFLRKITQQTTLPEFLNPLFDNPAEKLESILERHRSYLREDTPTLTLTRTEKRSKHSAGENADVKTRSLRWPKEEIEALILLKTDLDSKYHDNGPKGPLWEEISSCMKRLGYERSAKRCKEKWENINKYYRRVKDNKRRPGDSKTCPYFSMLEFIYAKKSKKPLLDSGNDDSSLKPEHILMQMIGQNQQVQPLMGEYGESDPQNQEDDAEDEHEADDDESGDGYEIVANNLSSVTTFG